MEALVVNSAGNEGNSSWLHIVAPADVNGDSLIAVGAVSSTGAYATFSSQGPTYDGRIKPDLVARGVSNPIPDVRAPLDPSAYFTLSGTSFSCPLVAGQIALLLAAPGGIPALNVLPPQLSAVVTNLLIQTSVDISVPNHGDPGFGRIDCRPARLAVIRRRKHHRLGAEFHHRSVLLRRGVLGEGEQEQIELRGGFF